MHDVSLKQYQLMHGLFNNSIHGRLVGIDSANFCQGRFDMILSYGHMGCLSKCYLAVGASPKNFCVGMAVSH